MDLLEEKWKKLQLTEEEHREIIVDEQKVAEENKKSLCSLVEKIQQKELSIKRFYDLH